mgnify:CR=1 FL=1
MALKELLKQRVMEKLNFSQEISDEHLKGVIQEEIMKISEEYPLLLSDKIRLNQEVFYALRRLDILQDLLEDDSVTEIMINGYKIFLLSGKENCTDILGIFRIMKNYIR